MYAKLALYIGLAVGGLAVGWVAASHKYKLDRAEYKNEKLTQANKQANDTIDLVNKRLADTADKANEARDRTQNTLDRLGELDRTHSAYLARVSSQTSELSNEINQLGIPVCVFGANYGGMWERIGEAANAGRGSVYQTRPDPSN